MEIKYEYKKPEVQILFTQPLMQEPGMYFATGEIDGDEEGGVLSKENDFFEEETLPVQKDIWADEE